MFLLGACMVYGRISIQSEPILNLVILGSQESQDMLHSLFLREDFVVHFHLFNELVAVHINDLRSGFPESVLIDLFALQIALVGLDQ